MRAHLEKSCAQFPLQALARSLPSRYAIGMLGTSAFDAMDGQIIAGKYRLLGLLGQGGMAEVFVAEHVGLRHTVAIKVLSAKTAVDPQIVARFLQEARATVRLSSEHVARVLDVGTLDSGLPYIVMEHLEGQDFARRIDTEGPFSIEDTVASILQVCAALAEAHAMGIVHRDLKPSNLFWTERPDGRPFVKVLDFGIAKIHEQCGGQGITTTNDVFGTPAYMSPEQIRSAKAVDARADIWSLGLILAECITGRPVYEAATKFGVLTAIIADPLPNLHLVRAGAPPALERVILRCLQKDPEQRHQDVTKLANALLPFSRDQSIWVSGIRRTVDEATDAVTIDARTTKLKRRVPKAAAWLGAAGLLGALATSLLSNHSRSQAASYASTTPSVGGSSADPGPADPEANEPRSDTHDGLVGTLPVETETSTDRRITSPKTVVLRSKPRGAGEARGVRASARNAASSGLEDRK